MKKILIIEHAPGRADGLSEQATKYGADFETWRPYVEETIPGQPSDYCGIIVGGGPMGVYQIDQYPFFRVEIGFIENAMVAKVPLLGICLGAQLFAHILGARVEKTFWRRGYMVVEVVKNCQSPMLSGIKGNFPTFQYHQDEIIELPAGTTLTLTSNNCTIEGFQLGDSPLWAIQSHPEINPAKARQILANSGIEPNVIESMLSLSRSQGMTNNTILFHNFFNFAFGKED